MPKQIIVIENNEGRAGTFLISQGFQRKHEYILRLINKYESRFKDYGELKTNKCSQGRGRPIEEYLLNEDQFIFLGTILRNSEIVLDFKQKLVKEFSKARRIAAAAQSRQQNQEWLHYRQMGKKQRIAMTDDVKDFVDYATKQGSKNADKYYMAISKMTYSLLFVFHGTYKNARNLLSEEQLMTIASAERIISKGLRDCMKAKMFYKDIYKKIKSNVAAFVELHGQTEVIEEQFKLEE